MKATNNILERQIIRFLCLVMAIWTMLSAVQLGLVYALTDYTSWMDKYINDNCLITFIIFIQFLVGLGLLLAKIKHSDKMIKISLKSMIAYNFALAGFSGYFTKAQSSFFLTYILIGLFSSILMGYYQKRNKKINDDRDLTP